jgi:hypothetical protein
MLCRKEKTLKRVVYFNIYHSLVKVYLFTNYVLEIFVFGLGLRPVALCTLHRVVRFLTF